MSLSLEASGLYLICKPQRKPRHCPLCLFPGLSGGVRSAQQAKLLKWTLAETPNLPRAMQGESAKVANMQLFYVDVSVELAAIAAFCNSSLPLLNCPLSPGFMQSKSRGSVRTKKPLFY